MASWAGGFALRSAHHAFSGGLAVSVLRSGLGAFAFLGSRLNFPLPHLPKLAPTLAPRVPYVPPGVILAPRRPAPQILAGRHFSRRDAITAGR